MLIIVLSYCGVTFLARRSFALADAGEFIRWGLLILFLFRVNAFRSAKDEQVRQIQDEIAAVKEEASVLQQAQDQKLRELLAAKVSMEERYAELYTLQIINEVANSELSIDILSGKVVDILTGLTGSTACSVILLNNEEPPSILATNIASPEQQAELTGSEALALFKRTLAADQTVTSAKLEEEPLLKRRGSRSFVAVPLRLKTGGSGVIFVEHNVENAFNTETQKILMAAADRLAVAIDNARLYDRMERMAVTDALTGVYNRLYLHQYLTKLVLEKKKLALAILDVDHFKRVNDTYGHLSGDATLRKLTALVKEMLPPAGFIARYGGEEFVIVLPDCECRTMVELAEEIREKIRQLRIIGENGAEFSVTVSFGVSAMPELADTAEKLLQSADQALYLAKESGRNRVCIANPLSKQEQY